MVIITNKITPLKERYFLYSRISQKTRIVFVVELRFLKFQCIASMMLPTILSIANREAECNILFTMKERLCKY